MSVLCGHKPFILSMKLKKITVITDHDNAEIVSSAMFDAGADGVEILDREDFASLMKSDIIWDYVDENAFAADGTVRVSAVVDGDDRVFLPALEKRLDGMKETGVRFGEITVVTLDDADWANEWKKYYKPIVADRITVVPTWIDYTPAAGERVMRLDPGMAFGTGEHETTRMCLDLALPEGRSVVDVGCGSGILGIAAALSGAKSVYMCDLDPQAVEAAEKNAELNGVDCVVEQADLLEKDIKADLILANLTADILMRFAPLVGDHLNAGGKLVVSGIIVPRADEVEEAFSECGFAVEKRAMRGDWCAFVLGRR